MHFFTMMVAPIIGNNKYRAIGILTFLLQKAENRGEDIASLLDGNGEAPPLLALKGAKGRKEKLHSLPHDQGLRTASEVGTREADGGRFVRVSVAGAGWVPRRSR